MLFEHLHDQVVSIKSLVEITEIKNLVLRSL
jgi:hypothetical protein